MGAARSFGAAGAFCTTALNLAAAAAAFGAGRTGRAAGRGVLPADMTMHTRQGSGPAAGRVLPGTAAAIDRHHRLSFAAE